MINYRYRFCTVIESVYTPRTWNYFTEKGDFSLMKKLMCYAIVVVSCTYVIHGMLVMYSVIDIKNNKIN